MPSGPKKRRAAKKKTLVRPANGTDPQVEANAVIDPTSVEVEDGLAVKPSVSSAAVELTEPVGTVSSKEAVLVDNVSSVEVVGLGSKENDGKDMPECARYSNLEVEANEPTVEGLDSGLKENDGKDMLECARDSTLKEVEVNEPTAEGLDSGLKENDGKDMLKCVRDTTTLKEVEGNEPTAEGLDSGLKENDGKDMLKCVRDSTTLKEVEGNEPTAECLDSGMKESDGKDMLECARDSTLKEVEGNEPTAEGLGSGLNENDGKPVVEDSLTDQLEFASVTVVSDEDDSVMFNEADFSNHVSVNIDEPENGRKLLIEAIDKAEVVRKSMEAEVRVAEAMVVRLQQMLEHLQQLLADRDSIPSTPTTTI